MLKRTDQKRPGKASFGLKGLGASFDLLHGLVEARVFQHLAGALHGGEMTFTQLNTIYFLFSEGPQTIAAIAERAEITHPAASRMVERMVQAGLVTRREGPADRRQKLVETTPAGIKRLTSLKTVTSKTYADLLAEVPPELLGRLAEILSEVKPWLPVHPLSKVARPE